MPKEPFVEGVKLGTEAVAGEGSTEKLLALLGQLAPDILKYIDSKRADRRHVFDLAFAAAETSEEKTAIATAFLDGGAGDLMDFADVVMKKAPKPS